MSKKTKKAMSMLLVVTLIAVIAVGGMLAYLQSSDSDVNVMTLGNVSIEQHEYERVLDDNGNPVKGVEGTDFSANYGITESYKLQDFTQNKPAYPAVYTKGNECWDEFQQLWNQVGAPGSNDIFDDSMKNVIDKFVFVENTGESDVYYRTIVAIERPDSVAGALIHINATTNARFDTHYVGRSEINGVKYDIYNYTYNEILTPGEVSRPSFLQVYLDPAAKNEDCAKFGDTWEILVLSQAVQAEGFADAQTALDTAFGKTSEKAAEWLEKVLADDAAAKAPDKWDGTADTSWYDPNETEFGIRTAEELAGLAKLVDEGNTFAGKTVRLLKDIDLGLLDDNGNPVSFEPIGDASNADFSGTFDGNNKTIYNLRQDCNSKHLALFGAVYEGTVKNLVLDGARIENDGSGYAAAVVAYAGASEFKNITLRNTTVANYNHNTGGVVAWCSNNGTTTTFDGINIEDTTTIASWWGSYDTRVGGIVGAMNTGNNVVIKDSTVACRLDVYNDVTSNYQWGNYRTAGMVVADVRDTHTVDGRTEANPVRVTCENVKVIFGDWAKYHYCESATYGTPSYADPGEYKFKRVEPGEGYGGLDISVCNHAADETHNELMEFNFLFGARDGKGIYGVSSFDGVTVVKK